MGNEKQQVGILAKIIKRWRMARIVRRVKHGSQTAKLSRGITIKVSLAYTIRGWVIKRVRSALTNDEITDQLYLEKKSKITELFAKIL